MSLLSMVKNVFTSQTYPRSTPSVFMGYSPTQSAYYTYDPKTSKLYTSIHVVFVETRFPFSKLTSTPVSASTINPDDWLPFSVTLVNYATLTTPSTTSHTDPTSTTPTTPSHTDPKDSPSLIPSNSPSNRNSPPSITIKNPTPFPKMKARSNPKTNPRYFNSDFHLCTATPSSPSKPTTITQALKSPSWRNVMQDEFNALERNQTWTLVPLSL
ncbi:hypothetical protein LXL04_039176 [Taraxacum kok-saghyz]